MPSELESKEEEAKLPKSSLLAKKLKDKIDNFELDLKGLAQEGEMPDAVVSRLLNEEGREILYEVDSKGGADEEKVAGKQSAREAFIDYLAALVHDKDHVDALQRGLVTSLREDEDENPRKNNPAKYAISLKTLLGKEGARLYKRAMKEEKNSPAFRDAIFSASTKHYRGKTWKERMILWCGGPSGSGKSHNADKVVRKIDEEVMEPDEDNNKGNYVVFIDGGAERKLSQIRGLAIDFACGLGYTGVSNPDPVKSKLKNKIQEAVVAQPDLNMAVVTTFTKYIKSVSKFFKYKELKNTKQIMSRVVAAPGNNFFKETIHRMAVSRAYKTDFDENLKFTPDMLRMNHHKGRPESKSPESHPAIGDWYSNQGELLFKSTINKSVCMHIENDLIAVRENKEKGSWEICDKHYQGEFDLITLHDFERWKESGSKKSPKEWLSENKKSDVNITFLSVPDKQNILASVENLYHQYQQSAWNNKNKMMAAKILKYALEKDLTEGLMNEEKPDAIALFFDGQDVSGVREALQSGRLGKIYKEIKAGRHGFSQNYLKSKDFFQEEYEVFEKKKEELIQQARNMPEMLEAKLEREDEEILEEYIEDLENNLEEARSQFESMKEVLEETEASIKFNFISNYALYPDHKNEKIKEKKQAYEKCQDAFEKCQDALEKCQESLNNFPANLDIKRKCGYIPPGYVIINAEDGGKQIEKFLDGGFKQIGGLARAFNSATPLPLLENIIEGIFKDAAQIDALLKDQDFGDLIDKFERCMAKLTECRKEGEALIQENQLSICMQESYPPELHQCLYAFIKNFHHVYNKISAENKEVDSWIERNRPELLEKWEKIKENHKSVIEGALLSAKLYLLGEQIMYPIVTRFPKAAALLNPISALIQKEIIRPLKNKMDNILQIKTSKADSIIKEWCEPVKADKKISSANAVTSLSAPSPKPGTKEQPQAYQLNLVKDKHQRPLQAKWQEHTTGGQSRSDLIKVPEEKYAEQKVDGVNLPNDTLNRIIFHQIDTLVRQKNNPRVVIESSQNPDYVKAVILECGRRGLEYKNKSDYEVDVTQQMHDAYRALYDNKYKSLNQKHYYVSMPNDEDLLVNPQRLINYGINFENGAMDQPLFNINAAYKTRVRSFINGAIYVLLHSDPVNEGKIKALQDLSDRIPENPGNASAELSRFLGSEIPRVSGLTAEDIALGESFYVWQERTPPTHITTYQDDDGRIIEQHEVPRFSALTSDQKEELLKIHDEDKQPRWFKDLPLFAQKSLQSIVPGGYFGDWTDYEKFHPATLRHIPGEANAFAHELIIRDQDGREISHSISYRQGVPSSYEMKDAKERQTSSTQNLAQMVDTLLPDAKQHFYNMWGEDSKNLPLPVLLGGLVSPVEQGGFISRLVDESLLTPFLRGLKMGDNNTEMAHEKEKSFCAYEDEHDDASLRMFNLNVGIDPTLSNLVQPDQNFIEFARMFSQKIKPSNPHYNNIILLNKVIEEIESLPERRNIEGRNANVYLAALYDVATRLMGGLATGNCKSNKDRKAIELIMADSMLLYLHQYDELPHVDERNPENRERWVKIFRQHYTTGHHLFVAHDNSPGSCGLKDTKYLDKDIKEKLKDSNMQGQYKQMADFNKPKLLSWKKAGYGVLVALLAVFALLQTAVSYSLASFRRGSAAQRPSMQNLDAVSRRKGSTYAEIQDELYQNGDDDEPEVVRRRRPKKHSEFAAKRFFTSRVKKPSSYSHFENEEEEKNHSPAGKK